MFLCVFLYPFCASCIYAAFEDIDQLVFNLQGFIQDFSWAVGDGSTGID